MTKRLPAAVRARLDWDAERLRARNVDPEPFERVAAFFRSAAEGRAVAARNGTPH